MAGETMDASGRLENAQDMTQWSKISTQLYVFALLWTQLTYNLDRAATKAFGTAVIQAHQAYARRATDPPPDLIHALQGPQTERVRESTAADLAVARREKYAKVWLTRRLVDIASSFRYVRKEIAKIQN